MRLHLSFSTHSERNEMPNIGTLPVTTFRSEADQIVYSRPGNTVSSTDQVALRRQLPVPKGLDRGVLRANARVAKTVVIGDQSKEMVFNISGQIPVGVATADVEAHLTDVVLEVVKSAQFKALMTAGDINVSD